MPLYVDYVGLNTLINEEVDLDGNFLGSPDDRLDDTIVQDKSFEVVGTSTIAFAGVSTPVSDTSFRTAFGDPAGGFGFSFWVNLNSTNGTQSQRVIASSKDAAAAFNTQTFKIEFRNDELRMYVASTTISENPNAYKQWEFSAPASTTIGMESNFFNQWKHVLFNWDGNFANNAECFVNGVAQNLKNTLNPTGLGGSAVMANAHSLRLMDHHAIHTAYELDGKLQNFTIYNSHITGSALAAVALYNNGTPITESLPQSASVMALYRLGNEPIFSEFNIGDSILYNQIVPIHTNTSNVPNLLQWQQSTTIASGPKGKTVIPNTHLAKGFLGRVANHQQLAALNAHRNGPYGFSSFRQARASQNPCSNRQRRSNTMTFVTPGPTRNVLPEGDLVVRDRNSLINSFKEPAITQKAHPLVWNVGRHFKNEDGLVDMNNPHRFSIISSYGNQLIGFANDRVDKLLRFDPDEEKTEYNAITEMYLDNGLDKLDSPLTHWEYLYYRETVYPIAVNQYRLNVRNRPQFKSFYRHARKDRSRLLRDNPRFSFPETSSVATFRESSWPMDAAVNFLTVSRSAPENLEESFRNSSKSGILQQPFSSFVRDFDNYTQDLNSSTLATAQGAADAIDSILAPYPMFARRNTLEQTSSIVSPSGMEIPQTGGVSTIIPFEGSANWDAGLKRKIRNEDGTFSLSPRHPFYDTYEDYVDEIKRFGKHYGVLPEFRMSTQMEDYSKTDGAIELDMFEVTGGLVTIEDSSKTRFYETYSTTDFMRHFEVITKDHEEFRQGDYENVALDVLALRCKAIKKFIPYEGFYPCQRTVDIAQQFYKSYKNNIKLENAKGQEINDFNYARQLVMTPLFAPGVLFNTIKSGIAVDYPIITGSLGALSESFGKGFYISENFDKRIPFKALVQPADYLAGYPITSNEPHPSGNLSASANWDGQGDGLYPLMINNFLAETINFFLPNGQLTSIVSKKQSDIEGIVAGDVYGMRVKMRRSMNKTRISVHHSGNAAQPYYPPQDIIKLGEAAVNETFTMYSRPSAFGPPTRGRNTDTGNSNSFFRFDDIGAMDVSSFATTGDGKGNPQDHFFDSRHGFNYPFTPPYYHGEAWCDIIFTASAETDTIKKIQASSSYSFTRFDESHLLSSAHGNDGVGGPQAISRINLNAVQLSASLNLRGLGVVIEEGTEENLVVDTGLAEGDRWVIQSLFETPMLNFNHVTGSEDINLPTFNSASVPRGIWHQYGRIPEGDQGVFISVGPIPDNYKEVVMNVNSADDIKDLSDLLGFAGHSTKLGRIALQKTISEAVVAVPFIEDEGKKRFFKADQAKVNTYKRFKKTGNAALYNSLITGEPHSQIGRSLLAQIEKMEKFIFPPSFDFLHFNVPAIAMYIFEFSHDLSQRDLQDIWQNLPPDIGQEMETQEIAITHPLLKKELLGNGAEKGNTTIPMPERLRWLVFKVKQRAANSYFEKTISRNPIIGEAAGRGKVASDEFGAGGPFQYNWPYDFFSLVEMAKIDGEVEIGVVNRQELEDYTTTIPDWTPRQSSREKILAVIGGIEDDPVYESDVPATTNENATAGISYAEYQDNWFKEYYTDQAIFQNSEYAGVQSSCVLPGTMIETKEGRIKVEDVLIGTEVLSYNFDTEEFGFYKVLGLMTPTSRSKWALVKTKTGKMLRCTEEHPLYNLEMKDNQIPINQMNQGDGLYIYEDGLMKKDSILSIEYYHENVTVYNFEVEGVHSYISDSILSHNKLTNRPGGSIRGPGGSPFDPVIEIPDPAQTLSEDE